MAEKGSGAADKGSGAAGTTRKVLLLGSGGLTIGQAGEFDYSGSQAIKAAKEEGIEVVLINPNIATIQTSEGMADKVYFLPVEPYFVERVIRKERPDGILLSFGGQTALNCGIALAESGALERHGVRVLGTPVEAIVATEDRRRFVETLESIGVSTPRSRAVSSVQAGLSAAAGIGYPVMIRAAYALGGRGSGIARGEAELRGMLERALSATSQVLVEECLTGWKEIEYEVMRDALDNCITICNMENLDPMGIHTGESIVVAPSQTLTNAEYHKLREIAIRVIRRLGIVGECNIQYAFDPRSEEYRVIEVNARLSRSSALASKATGYPIAFVAAKLAFGAALPDLRNSITRSTTACFEPALDYIVLKFPRWDLNKFKVVSRIIGSEMKSVGEVMAIGRSFEEALQKAIRMLHVGMYGLVGNGLRFDDVEDAIANPTDMRIFAVAEAIRAGVTVGRINELSGIDPWFLHKIANIVEMERTLASAPLDEELLLEAKRMGFSDYQVGGIVGRGELEVRRLRKRWGILPAVKQIDTLAAEYPAKTNYLYLTYGGAGHDVDYGALPGGAAVIVLGSGAYRIGSSVEFDWCCVNAAKTAKELGHATVMINCNPETVSTDYDECDRLYFEELSFERVLDVYELEEPLGLILSMGGQIPNNLAMKCHAAGLRVLGTSPQSIDRAEDRHKFSRLLDEIGIDQPPWRELTTLEEAKRFATRVGYPVLVRPSYVLSGAAMNVIFNEENMEKYITAASSVSPEHPVVISKFIEGAKEIEIDAVASKGTVVIYAMSEHIEPAGVHSGDATMVLPPQRIWLETVKRVKRVARELAGSLEITGPFNVQFIAKDNDVKVIECNLRASRSFPFVSKVFKHNFIDIATRAILGRAIPPIDKSSLELDYVGVKSAQFSFSRLKEADPVCHVEMASTGEVGCLGDDVHDAFLKSYLSTGMRFPRSNVLLSVSGDENRFELLEAVKTLEAMNFTLYATEHTAEFYRRHGVETRMVHKIHEERTPNVSELLGSKKLDLIISMPRNYGDIGTGDTYVIRRAAVDYSIPLVNDVQIAKLFIAAISKRSIEDLEIRSWDEYD
jgi:carbamoyl-phosphate synthase large subunit